MTAIPEPTKAKARELVEGMKGRNGKILRMVKIARGWRAVVRYPSGLADYFCIVAPTGDFLLSGVGQGPREGA